MAAQRPARRQPCCRAKRKSASARSTASSAPRSRASICAGRSPPAQFKVVHDAFVNYEVIVLRDQDITVDQQMAFGALFGELSIHPFSPNLPDKPEVIILDYSADNPPALTDIWHVDETFRETPPMATILRGKVVPEVGGDTLFASMSAAYRGLQRAHEAAHPRAGGAARLQAVAAAVRPRATAPSCASSRTISPIPWHPVVRVHPVIGPARALRQPPVLHPHQGPQGRRERHAAGVPLPPGHHPRVPAPGEVAAQHAGDVGQPLGPALCQPRLLSGAAHHGARDGEGRQAGGRRAAPTRPTRCRPTAR